MINDESTNQNFKVNQKWGFGMAPIKKEVDIERIGFIKEVLKSLEDLNYSSDETQNANSQVKGLFTRIYKQDQWDWFTVWIKLGRPGILRAKRISEKLYDLRKSQISKNSKLTESLAFELSNLGFENYLNNYLSSSVKREEEDGIGKIYILSNRENKNILKIGYTNRSVEERVKEINSSTGVLIPYGVRAMWMINSASEVEAEIHQLLSAYRIRTDREFFQMDFRDAFRFISDYIRERRKEI
jgi:hypothetical protein